MDEIFTTLETFEKAYKLIKKIDDKNLFFSLIGMIIDQWGADKHLAPEEIFEMTESLAENQKIIYDELGMMDESDK